MEMNELMVSWWWEIIGIVGMLGVGALSGCLVWYGKTLKKEKEKFKKQIDAMNDNYGRLSESKCRFENEYDRLTDENAALKTLVDNKSNAITVLDNENKTLKKLLSEKTVLKVGYSSVPTQEFRAEAVESKPDYVQIDDGRFATDDEIKKMIVNKCVERICEDMMQAGAFDIREEFEDDLMNCCKNRRITVKARAAVFPK